MGILRTSIAAVLLSLLTLFASAQSAQALVPDIVKNPNGKSGTVILVHGSGWSGSIPALQKDMMNNYAPLLIKKDFRVVTIAYEPGAKGALSILIRAKKELKKDPRLCLVGSSSGAHISYLAAAQEKRIDCVVMAAGPTDLNKWYNDETMDPTLREIARDVLERAFGPYPFTPYLSPTTTSPVPRAKISYVRQVNDPVIPYAQLNLLKAARGSFPSITVPATNTETNASNNSILHGYVTDNVREGIRRFVLSQVRQNLN